MEALASRIAESFPGSESAVGSPARDAQDDIVQQLTVGVQGAIFDILEEMGADEHVVELLSRAGEMSPEAEAVNAAILSGVRKGTENYGRKLGLMGGPKPVQAVAEGEEDNLAEAGRSSDDADAIAGHTSWSRQAGEDAHRAKLRAAQVADAKARLRKDRLAKKTGKPVESDAERRAKRYRNPEHYHEEKRRN